MLNSTLHWTQHAQQKSKYYRLSENRIKRVLKNYNRIEQGIAEGTTACMQRNDTKKRQEEIWVMFTDLKVKGAKVRKIISVWRYPGISPEGQQIPIPQDILSQLIEEGVFK